MKRKNTKNKIMKDLKNYMLCVSEEKTDNTTKWVDYVEDYLDEHIFEHNATFGDVDGGNILAIFSLLYDFEKLKDLEAKKIAKILMNRINEDTSDVWDIPKQITDNDVNAVVKTVKKKLPEWRERIIKEWAKFME